MATESGVLNPLPVAATVPGSRVSPAPWPIPETKSVASAAPLDPATPIPAKAVPGVAGLNVMVALQLCPAVRKDRECRGGHRGIKCHINGGRSGRTYGYEAYIGAAQGLLIDAGSVVAEEEGLVVVRDSERSADGRSRGQKIHLAKLQ